MLRATFELSLLVHPFAQGLDCGSARPAVAALGGGIGPDDVRGQVDAAGGHGLLGSCAYADPAGLEAAVRRAVDSL